MLRFYHLSLLHTTVPASKAILIPKLEGGGGGGGGGNA